MNPFQQIQTPNQMQFLAQLQQLQQVQYLQLVLALGQGMQAAPALTPLQQLAIFQQSSQRTIQMGTGIASVEKKCQSERILPKCIKREDSHLLKQFPPDQIVNELKFALNHFCKDEQAEITQELRDNTKILEQIDARFLEILQERYLNQKKTKEEQIKFILRKCFKFLKSRMNINELTLSAYEVEKLFYKEYFGENGSVDDLIPFRSESTNKTMNTQYLKKIFASAKFVEGYSAFLDQFNEIWDQENNEKINNMAKQIVKFIQAGQIDRIKSYKRVPWIQSMKKKCFELAVSFRSYANNIQQDFKLDDDADNEGRKQVKQ